MIFTIGLGNLEHPHTLGALARKLGARVIDVRASLKYRRAGFGRLQLAAMFEQHMVHYEHRPDLGGLPVSQRATGRKLPAIDARKLATIRFARVLLVCACGTPGDCHRHITIGEPLAHDGVDVWHIYYDDEHGEQFIHASELQRAIDDDDDYEFFRARQVL